MKQFVKAANANSPTLFPQLTDLPEQRTRAIAAAVKEFQRLPIQRPHIKKLVLESLSRIDTVRIEGKANAKKSKLTEKTLNESASAFAECKRLVPYLELAQPKHSSQSKALDVSADSLPGFYWRVKEGVIDEKRLEGRKYWQYN